ncbi:MAG: hypothetical protein K9J16_01920 [Melioribacteraceae bacterium]|nr:hypothetical protein [Melioribacteraceae bacterium]MCF8353023.1 hypothetical protein [Melioribacteraceae bacterium]MCF8392914.1 hypothetical protein [Melioribacteraceae bacterium]MCF8417792.1 hypothetical protein [Melioribacteraceae bacterium]
MRYISNALAALLLGIIAAACSTFRMEPADYSWPVESVLIVDEEGVITDTRYSFDVNVSAMFQQEEIPLPEISGREVRVIRDQKGYYFMTSQGLRNVYVFLAEEGGMNLVSKILVNSEGVNGPAFNQRSPYIEFIQGDNQSTFLTKDGIRQ